MRVDRLCPEELAIALDEDDRRHLSAELALEIAHEVTFDATGRAPDDLTEERPCVDNGSPRPSSAFADRHVPRFP